MDYKTVPTTVFTPIEYGAVGLSEEEAIEKHGEDNIEVYHIHFQPLEWQFNKMRPEKTDCYTKVIVNLQDNERVLGFHIVAPNAGEVTQGIGVAMKCGVTKEQLDSCVGIHPTIAEEACTLKQTKRENPDAAKTSC